MGREGEKVLKSQARSWQIHNRMEIVSSIRSISSPPLSLVKRVSLQTIVHAPNNGVHAGVGVFLPILKTLP